ncbi:MAG TPA: peptide-methionine (S)-S-oxide reductase MsrA [Gammaproteobacteria bacterium]|nr:peptide-methionine (S)-S-oxide reductase MsrA [Gammaproteobacteria bacterium]
MMVTMVKADQALQGRQSLMPLTRKHGVLNTPLREDFDKKYSRLVVGMGCFWGAERLFWKLKGVYTTAVGYAGGFTPNPEYEEVCSGMTGHAEVVLIVYDPTHTTLQDLLAVFWAGHDPTQGMRQGNDTGTQYRSAVYPGSDEEYRQVISSRDRYAKVLAKSGLPAISTEIRIESTFYYAEEYHQQYLAKNPSGYCGLKGTGVDYS